MVLAKVGYPFATGQEFAPVVTCSVKKGASPARLLVLLYYIPHPHSIPISLVWDSAFVADQNCMIF